jgi:hypothetical protein
MDTDRHPEGCDCMPCSEYEQPCLCCGSDIPLRDLRDDHCAACITSCDFAGCRLRDRCYGCAGSGVTQGRYVSEFKPIFERMSHERIGWLMLMRRLHESSVDSARWAIAVGDR